MGFSSEEKIAVESASMHDGDKLLTKTSPLAPWPVPDVALDPEGTHLVFDWEQASVATDRDLLNDFTKIEDSRTALQCAKRWGPLGLCEHGIPATHNPHSFVEGRMRLGCYPSGWEPVDAWVRYAREARALVLIGANLRNGVLGGRGQWKHVLIAPASRVGRSVEEDRLCLGGALTSWLQQGQIHVLFGWPDLATDEPVFQWRAGSLLLAVGVEIAGAITRTSGVAICSGCGELFPPARRQRPGRRSYCAECREKRIDKRDAERAYEARQKEKAAKSGQKRRSPRKGTVQ